jgi:hypothetical protein
MNASACIVGGDIVTAYNRTAPDTALYIAPIRCGTWLGARDSAWNASWFASGCFSILENRFQADAARLSACGAERYTTGCRFTDTNQRWVPECRSSDLTECGVQTPCPSPNPCGLGPDIETNLNNRFLQCAATTHLALNVSASEEDCYEWDRYAFLLDGYCVASCGRIDNQCVLKGSPVPRCNTERDPVYNSIVRITPEVCAVPMPSDTFAGFRNGFYGMSREVGSRCLVATLPNSSPSNCSIWPFMCFRIEGLFITPLAYEQSSRIPLCIGHNTAQCKIEYPCPTDDNEDLDEPCDGPLRISRLMYTRFNVHDCGWFRARDIVIIIHWGLVFIGSIVYLAAADEKADLYAPTALTALAVVAAALVWEFAWVALLLYMLPTGLYRLVSQPAYHSLTQTPETTVDVARVSIDTQIPAACFHH